MIGYLYVEGIKGEVQEAEHPGWMKLLSVEQSIHRPMDPGLSEPSRHRSQVFFEEISVVKEVDLSTPRLADAVADGTNFSTVSIHLVTSSSAGKHIPYLIWDLHNARVTSYNIKALEQASRPVEQISFSFAAIRQTYIQLGNDDRQIDKSEYNWQVQEGVP